MIKDEESGESWVCVMLKFQVAIGFAMGLESETVAKWKYLEKFMSLIEFDGVLP